MFDNLNVLVFNFINGFAGSNSFLDNLMIVLAKYLPFVFILFLLFLWFFKRERDLFFFAVYSLLLGLLLNFVISSFYFHPRPFMDGLGLLLINHSANASFPSDHTTFMLSMAFLLLFFRNSRLAGVVLSVLGFLGGIARVFCGVHYPFDILGSVVVSFASALLVYLLADKLLFFNNFFTKVYDSFLRYFHKKVF